MKNIELGKKVKSRRKEIGMTQSDLADAMGYGSRSTITRLERGDYDMKRSKLVKLAKVLNTTVEYFLDEVPNRIPVPVYDDIKCGYAVYVDENPTEYMAIPQDFVKPNHEYFANRASGDSMIGAGINEGDILIFEKVDMVSNGEIGSFEINGEYNCKKFKRASDRIVVLESENDDYEPIVVDLAIDDFRVLGKLTSVLKKWS